MRIDGNIPAQDAQATDGTRRTAAEATGRTSGSLLPKSTSSDRVELSGDAALLAGALRAANAASDVRSDRVEAARERLQQGRVGADPLSLADAILRELLP